MTSSSELIARNNLPILDTTDKQELARQIEVIVEHILLVKSKNRHLEENISVDTSELESQIDQLVYQLYDLTAEEIGVID